MSTEHVLPKWFLDATAQRPEPPKDLVRRGMTADGPGSPVTFCDGHRADFASRALAKHQPLGNFGITHP
jgi:hypothetical protein